MRWEYIVDAEEMQRADHNTIEHFKIPQLVLMERAALAARDLIRQKWRIIFEGEPKVLIACGNGNNGGDGAALARLLFLTGCDVTVLVSGEREKYSPAMRTQMEILERYREKGDKPLHILPDEEWISIWDGHRQAGSVNSAAWDLVIDALFGIGLSREITGIYRKKTEWLNGLSGKKAALDISSGISAKDGHILGCAFRADLTVTFGFQKRGMSLYPGREICGEVIVADIGITEESFLGEYPAGMTIGRDRWREGGILPRRNPNGHKGSFGKVLLSAGSAGTPGAALLAGEAVLRSGAGMLQIVSPAENRELILTRLPEAMYQALTEQTDREKLFGWCDAVVIGPGIGQDIAARKSMEEIMTFMSENRAIKPVILDADGLNLLASSERLFQLVKIYTAQGGLVIMTPHMAELARLLHCSMADLQRERMEKLEGYCRETGAILVSKDAATVVGFHDSTGRFRYYVNQTGNSGMATAGSGDVLSGITGALLAYAAVNHGESGEKADRKAACFEAVCHAVYLHGLAGDMAAEKCGEVSMKAGDIIAALPETLKFL